MNKHQASEKKNDNMEKPLTPLMPPPPPTLERTTSIDDEPKTLLEEEMKVARV